MHWLITALAGPLGPRQITRWILTLGAAVTILTLVSCATSEGNNLAKEKIEPMSGSASKDGVTLTIRSEKSSFARTEDVKVTLSVKNNSQQPVVLNFSSGQHFDLKALGAGNDEVFSWSSTKAFTQALEKKTLLPGEEFEDELSWQANQGNGSSTRLPGTYTLVGSSTAKELKGLEAKGDISIM